MRDREIPRSQEEIPVFHIDINAANQFLLPMPVLPDYKREAKPFFIIYPSRVHQQNTITRAIEQHGHEIDEIRPIHNFEAFAKYTYPPEINRKHTYLWLAVNRLAYSHLPDIGLAITLQDAVSEESMKQLASLKHDLRFLLRPFHCYANFREELVPIRIHHVHVPEYNELSSQFNSLVHFSSEKIIFEK